MSYPNNQGQVENKMILTFPNPFNDPILKRINECYEREDLEYEAMFSEDRFEYMERYCKANLEPYLRWIWENRRGE